MNKAVAAAAAAIVLVVVVAAYFLLGGGGGGQVRITGSGSTFIYPQMQAWIDAFTQRNPDVIVEYSPTGSGTGQAQMLVDKTVDFAASDPPLTREQYERYKGKVLQVPVILGAVAIVYNIPGVEELRLNGEVLALIYLGEIEYWDDPRIAELNPGVELPHERIIAVHRSDSSGTTHVFTLFLYKASNGLWPRDLVGKSIEWPVDAAGRGIGAKGNQGVAQAVKATEYSIGYVEYSYAIQAGFKMAYVENAAGEYLQPSPESIQAAARAAAAAMPDSPLGDWSGVLDAIVYPEGRGAYPIASFSFLILWKEYPQEKAEAIKEFLRFILTEGDNYIVEGYVAVPEEVKEVGLKAVDLIEASG